MRSRSLTLAALLLIFVMPAVWAQDVPDAPAGPPRLANGAVIDGTVLKATPDGLTVQTPKGPITYPWKYLSVGTRYRYERPMLAELKAKAEAEAKEAARKAAAAQRAAEAKAKKEAEEKAKKEAAAAAGATNTTAIAADNTNTVPSTAAVSAPTNASSPATNAPPAGK